MRLPIRTTVATVAALALLSGVAGCGGGDEKTEEPQAKATPTKVETPKTWPPKGAEKGGLAEYPYLYGVSWEAPVDWTFKKEKSDGYESFSWTTGKDGKGGIVFVTVRNDRQTAEEWEQIAGQTEKGTKQVFRKKVDVPGYGAGIHRRWTYETRPGTRDTFIVTSIDGVLLQVDVVTPSNGDTALADQVIASVKREAA